MKYNLLISILLICITIEVEKKDYLKEAAHWVDIVYNKVYESGCVHKSPTAKTFEEIPQKKTISCSASASITYQQAGLIAKGKKVSHTASIGKKDKKSYYDNSNLKKSLLLSFTHAQNLKKGTCDFVKVMKHYDEMPDWLKQKGIMYVQDSNICVSAGKGKIYSCNSTGKKYGKGGVKVLKTNHKEYALKSLILWAVVPRTNGKTNVPENSNFKFLPCGL